MSSEEQTEHLELSVEETNKLRAKLGLAPLRGVGTTAFGSTSAAAAAAAVPSARGEHEPGNGSSGGGEKKEEVMLELSVQATNALRAQLGLAPLREAAAAAVSNDSNNDNTTTGSIVHRPAINLGAETEAAARIERARLQRQVQQGMTKTFGQATLADDASTAETTGSSGGALSWAQQMRRQKQANNGANKDSVKNNDITTGGSKRQQQQQKNVYNEQDLSGINVAHSLGEFQEGATTILTLADTEILQSTNDDDDNNDYSSNNKNKLGLNDDDDDNIQLENVNMVEQRKQQDGLRQKRKVEMGMGRAGGYAGFDDDEFEELGGTQGPSRAARTGGSDGKSEPGKRKSKSSSSSGRRQRQGFQIGAALQERDEEEEEESSDLFAAHAGKPISLDSSATGVENSIASDFMTAEEEQEAQLLQQEQTQQRAVSKKKKKHKDAKFKKHKKKKKDKKKNKRQVESDAEDDDEEEEETKKPPASTKSLLDELEETAADDSGHVARKRKRSNNDAQGDDEDDEEMPDNATTAMDVTEEKKQMVNQRARYDAIMAKGNQRTRAAFQPATTTTTRGGADDDEEPDDAFLNAAISKARRLNRLKAMSESSSKLGGATTTTGGGGGGGGGADEAIAASLQQQKRTHPDASLSSGGGKTVVFSVDDTREFTRSLLARAEQAERDQARKAAKKEKNVIQAPKSIIKTEEAATANNAADEDEKAQVDEEEETSMDIEELAKEVKVEEEDISSGLGILDGSIGAASKPLGRGIGNVLNMLKQTGEITRKNAGKEEQRGRARDEHLDNEVDLSEVVKIDDRTATDKDKEMARRSIKLEYRDKHGRLLTPKEAYRDLSYHFHGYGSGKRKEEKKLQQIAREQAASRMSQQAAEGGSFGALKKTQKATGKAFVVHKT